jgi:hypothetical protein
MSALQPKKFNRMVTQFPGMFNLFSMVSWKQDKNSLQLTSQAEPMTIVSVIDLLCILIYAVCIFYWIQKGKSLIAENDDKNQTPMDYTIEICNLPPKVQFKAEDFKAT